MGLEGHTFIKKEKKKKKKRDGGVWMWLNQDFKMDIFSQNYSFLNVSIFCLDQSLGSWNLKNPKMELNQQNKEIFIFRVTLHC